MSLVFITVLSLLYTTSTSARNVPYNGSCTFTHDCADWRDGRVICDCKKRCSCRPLQNGYPGKIFWDSRARRCVHCTYGQFQQNSRCYHFDHQLLTWADARNRCQTTYNSDLIVFNSLADLTWLRDLAVEIDNEHMFPGGMNFVKSQFWIGAMNEPFVKFGNFTWIDRRGFTFDQNSSMWCRPGVGGLPSHTIQQPTWDLYNESETRVSLVRWSRLNSTSLFCLEDESPNNLMYSACEINATTFRTRCDETRDFCQNEGVCTAVTGTEAAQCDCTETPYGGTRCAENCGALPSHCLNGGNCTEGGVCTCTSLWTGNVCAMAKDPCLSNPCQHSSTCAQVGNTPNFTCDCGTSGWTGELCHLSIYPCPPGRCQHNGQCKPVGRVNFTCNCLKTGYQGVLCEEGCLDTDQPCRNGGSCIENECYCSLTTAGDFCETIIDRGSAGLQKDKTNAGLKLALIIILCAVTGVLIIGLVYSRRKFFKGRAEQTDVAAVNQKSGFGPMRSKQVDDTDSVSIMSTSITPST